MVKLHGASKTTPQFAGRTPHPSEVQPVSFSSQRKEAEGRALHRYRQMSLGPQRTWQTRP